MSRKRERCQSVEVDGQPISICGRGPLSEEDLGYLTEVVRAAKAKHRAEHPDLYDDEDSR